jgi:uncharacterized protein (DUF58 family)
MAQRANRGFRLTPEGWGWFAIGFVLWGIGFYKGINLLLLVAYAMLLLLVLNALLAGRQLRQLRARRQIPGPIFAAEPATVDVSVEGTPASARLGLRLEDRGEVHEQQWFLDQFVPGGAFERHASLVLPRRGWYTWNEPRLVSGYPFGLVERSAEGVGSRVVLVYPSRGKLHRGRLRKFLARALPGMSRSRLPPRRHPSAQSEFHGLREFRAGDSPRWIHWRTSARRGELMVREFEDLPSDDLILVVEPWLPSAGRKEESDQARLRLERVITFATTVCLEWCRKTGDRLVLAVAGPSEPVVLNGLTGREYAHLLMETLALIPGGTIHVDRLTQRLSDRSLPQAPILLVSTHAPTLGETLSERLRRPVVSLSADDLERFEFYSESRDGGD